MNTQLTTTQDQHQRALKEFVKAMENEVRVSHEAIQDLEEQVAEKDRTISVQKNALLTLAVLFIGLAALFLMKVGA